MPPNKSKKSDSSKLDDNIQVDELINQSDLNQLIKLYFKQPNILYEHLFSSYHQFIEEIIPYSLNKENNYFYESITDSIYLHGFKCDNIRIKPSMISPKETRTKHLKYFAIILADVTQFVEKEDLVTGDKTITTVGEIEKDVNIASIPIMVKSKYCTTCIKSDLLEECKYDPGGYFIVNGKEKIIMSIEKMVDNKILIFSKSDPTAVDGKTYLAHINSRQDDWSDNLQILTIKNKKNGELVLSNSQFADIPLFIIMRALGLESDIDIISNITYNMQDIEILNLLRPSIIYSTDENGVMIRTKEEAFNYLITKLKRNRRISMTDETLAIIQKKMYLEKILRRDLLPHLGEDIPKKIRFLGLMVNKLLLVLLKRRQVDDRDGFDNKRIETPGVLLGQLFRQNWKKQLNEIGKIFKRKNQSDTSPINMTNQLKPTIIEQGIKTALATGIWGMNRTKKGVAQSLQRISWILALSNLRRIMSPSLDASTTKVISIRHVNNITYGFICPVQTPEGQKIGIVKSLAMMSTITNQNVSQRDILCEILLEWNKVPNYKHPFDVDPLDMNNWSKIIFNGDWIGCTKSVHTLYSLLIQKRNDKMIDKMTSIFLDFEEKELRVYYDAGRLIRPLLKIKNNDIVITKDIIDEAVVLLKKESTKGWNKLLNKYPEIISYEDIESTKFIMSAEDLECITENNNNMKNTLDNNIINRYGNNKYVRYTHIEFHRWVMLGEVACAIPFANHNYGTKNIINFSQAKQSIGLYLTSYKDRMDISQVLYHPQQPLVTTEGMNYNNMSNLPSGENAIVAIMSYTGYNQEDSLIFNQAAIDRGIFRVDTLKIYHSEIEKNPSTSQDDIFIKPDRNKVTGMKQGNYDKLNERGFIPEETMIDNEDIIIGKVSPIQPTGNNNKVYKDSSEIFKSNIPGVIDRVHTNIFNSDGYEQYNVRVRMERIPVIGDKFACYDDSHSIMTSEGWINIKDITLEDKVGAIIDGKLQYVNPTEVQSYDYKGDMYCVESNQINLCVTPNHRMWVRTRDGKYKMELAQDILGKQRYYKKNVEEIVVEKNPEYFEYNGDVVTHFKIDDTSYEINAWLTFFGIWIAEGCVDKINITTRFEAHKQRVKDKLNEISPLLNLTFFTSKDKNTASEKNIYTYSNKIVSKYIFQYSVGAVNKFLPKWVWNLSPELCRVLICGMMLGDGHTMENGTRCYDTSSSLLADDFTRLCLHAGYSTNKMIKYKTGHESTIITCDSYRLTIIEKQNEPLVNKNISTGKQLDKMIPFDGKVYCCSVPGEGIIYVKRNEIVCLCGNSKHGQKGTLGIALQQKDMPFTEDGMVPDLIMNPHAIPSRMTVGQIVESLTSKIGAIEGKFMDGTPFNNYNVRDLPNILKKLGYSAYGTETMYCGITGKKIDTEVFIGPTYYMRLKHMVLDKVHCLTLDHEVLTGSGWKYFHDIKKDDTIATLNKMGIIEYMMPTDLHYYPNYKGKMYYIKNQAIDLNVTDGHRMYVAKKYGRAQPWKEYELIEAKDIYGKFCKFKKNGILKQDSYQFSLPEIIDGNNITQPIKNVDMKAWLTFFGIWIAKGSCIAIKKNTCKHYTTTISVNKIRVNDTLYPALEKLGYNYTINNEKCRINDIILHNYMNHLSVGTRNKFLPEWVWKLNQEQCIILLESMILCDGFYRKTNINNVVYNTSSTKLADDIMRLCLHCGWSCNKELHSPINTTTTVLKNGRKYNNWRLAIIKNRCEPSINHEHIQKQHIQEESLYDFEGEVFCVSVPNEVFYVRRNGKPVWTGNSRARGPRQALTRQPLDGRARAGGLKVGEMEKDSMEAHGIGQFIKERMMETSDIETFHICDNCGLLATRVIDKDYYVCIPCNNHSRISSVNLPYACKLLFQELMSINILPRIKTDESKYD